MEFIAFSQLLLRWLLLRWLLLRWLLLRWLLLRWLFQVQLGIEVVFAISGRNARHREVKRIRERTPTGSHNYTELSTQCQV